MLKRQRGISLINLFIGLSLLGFVGIMGAKLLPSYVEFFAVKKILATMEQAGDLKGTVKEIRRSYDTRNAIEDVKSIRGEELEITKDGGETVVTAQWSVKVPLVANVSACIDFYVSTAK